MRIGICDDEKLFREELSQICLQFFEKRSEREKILRFSSLNDLFDFNKSIDILFLDIEFPEKPAPAQPVDVRVLNGKREIKNGIELMERFQKIHEKALIIFVTNYEQYINEAFGRNVVGFLKKPVNIEQVFRILDKALNIMNMETSIKISEREYLGSNHIRYISGQHVYSKVHKDDDTSLVLRMTLKEWEEELLDFGFIRVNKSHLVNLAFVEQMEKGKVYLSDQTMTLGRNLRETAEQAYDRYKRRMAVYY